MTKVEVVRKEVREELLCKHGCPAGVNVPKFIRLAEKGKFDDALAVMQERNPFPSFTGHTCNAFCEKRCRRSEVDAPVAINAIERFVSEQGKRMSVKEKILTKSSSRRIAIVGSGPAGLSAAYYLASYGYRVTIFEALSVPGGMLSVGIPAYRLPRDIVQREINYILKMGVDIKLNTTIGDDLSLADIKDQGYKAIFLAIGAHEGLDLKVKGNDLMGVYKALDFLSAVNLRYKVSLGKNVAVIGGGYTAVDAARVARRLGATNVSLIYRRSAAEMPANEEEVKEAKEEDIHVLFLASPTKITGDDTGRVKAIELIKMKLGRRDKTGRRTPIPIKDSEHSLEVDNVITAIGQRVKHETLSKGHELDITNHDTFKVDPLTLQSNIPWIFCGGDAISGSATIIDAIAAGRVAAISIDNYLGGKVIGHDSMNSHDEVTVWTGFDEKDLEIARLSMPVLPPNERIRSFHEVRAGFSKDMVLQEAARCLHCDQPVSMEIAVDRCTHCYTCQLICSLVYTGLCNPEKARVILGPSEISYTDECIAGCSLCSQYCPQDAIAIKE